MQKEVLGDSHTPFIHKHTHPIDNGIDLCYTVWQQGACLHRNTKSPQRENDKQPLRPTARLTWHTHITYTNTAHTGTDSDDTDMESGDYHINDDFMAVFDERADIVSLFRKAAELGPFLRPTCIYAHACRHF